MHYIISAYEYDPDFYEYESLFKNGYDTDTIYIPTTSRDGFFSHNADTVQVNIAAYTSIHELQAALQYKYHIFPVYAYEHGNITLSLTPFSCPWDSRIVALALIPNGIDAQDARKALAQEIEYENNLANGDHYYVIDSEENLIVASCTLNEIPATKKQYNAEVLHAEETTIYVNENGKEVTL